VKSIFWSLYEILFLDITDLEKFFPGLMKATVEWLRIYKIPDGKPENQFAFNGEFKDRNFALKIIQEMNKHWEGLISQNLESRNISW
jgi:inorganic pyrophosphatase